MINCPNPSCKTVNPEGADVCQVCQSALPHHYLWGVGDLVSSMKPGQLLYQRYLLKRVSGDASAENRLFLDTKPGVVPESLPELPNVVIPYLHLSAYPIHVPRPYSILRTPDQDYVLLLESSAFAAAGAGAKAPEEAPELLPMLTQCWADAPPLRQLNWLWQIAQLWDAFANEQVASTLLDASLVRVDGSILRLLALAEPVSEPAAAPPTLMDLARSWQPLVETSHQAVRAFLDRLCDRLERQQINAEQLAEQLSQAMSVCGTEQSVGYSMVVYTDQGPTRKRNEDACYPDSGTSQTLTSDETRAHPRLLIVCDGIGGHQGGDVASKLAIATIRERLMPLLTEDRAELTSTELTLAIEAAVCAANDEISAQNDRAQRQARDRMGTTLVLALVKGADVYIAHLGDSRAYRISQQNCQQVTLDDDVASRQVRLGGSLYREVLMQPGSGSLIQALGMGSSQMLRPTVQRFVLDENCVFLLCSDGLSDSDRVEQFWQGVLRPLVAQSDTADRRAAQAGKQLVDLANKYNGHDNVTVGLLSAQVLSASARIVPRELPSVGSVAITAGRATASPGSNQPAPPRTQRPQTSLMTPEGEPLAAVEKVHARSASKPSKLPAAAVTLVVLALLGGVLYFLFPGLSWRFRSSVADAPAEVQTASDPPASDSPPGSEASPRVAADLKVNSYARINGVGSQLRLYPKPVTSPDPDPNVLTGTIPIGGIVQVVSKQKSDDQSLWVQLKLCSIPSGDSLADAPAESDEATAVAPVNQPESTQIEQPLILPPDSEGWVVEAQAAAVSESISGQDLQPTQKGNCES
ncbi:MAG: protein phosphatase 2C domain-containing protein [Phormidesmis sp.]